MLVHDLLVYVAKSHVSLGYILYDDVNGLEYNTL